MHCLFSKSKTQLKWKFITIYPQSKPFTLLGSVFNCCPVLCSQSITASKLICPCGAGAGVSDTVATASTRVTDGDGQSTKGGSDRDNEMGWRTNGEERKKEKYELGIETERDGEMRASGGGLRRRRGDGDCSTVVTALGFPSGKEKAV